MAYLRGNRLLPRLPASVGVAAVAATFAKPRALAGDYRSNASEFSGGTAFDATALALHKKYKYSLLNMQPGQAAPGQPGYLFVQALVADDATRKVFQYSIATQQFDSNYGGTTYSPVYNGTTGTNGLNQGAGGQPYWARDKATNHRTRTPVATGFGAYEVNLCQSPYTTANVDGNYAPQIIAIGLKQMMFTNLIAAGLAGFFQDNVWMTPGGYVTNGSNTLQFSGSGLDVGTGLALSSGALTAGEYNVVSGLGNISMNQNRWATRDTAPYPVWRTGLAAYVTKMKQGTSLLAMGNADADFFTDATYGNSALATTELNKVYDYGFIEAILHNLSNDSPTSQIRGQFGDVLNRIYTQADGSITEAVVASYVVSGVDNISRTLQKARNVLGTALLADCMCCVSDRVTTLSMRPFFYQELDVQIGTPVDARPTADNVGSVGYSGMYKRQYTNSLIVVNPSSNKGRWMNNAAGTFTIVRTTGASNNVVLTWTSLTAATAAAITNGVTRIRIQDCTTNATFNGVFVITAHTSTTITWSQPTGGSIVAANLDHPLGYFGIQSTVDLTGAGWKRITTTDDAPSASGYNGVAGSNLNYQVSQNDGSLVTILSLWPNDAVILIPGP